MPEQPPSKQPESNALVMLLNIGGVYFVLALIGLWLDKKFHTAPLCTLIAIGIGLIYFLYQAWLMYRQQHGR